MMTVIMDMPDIERILEPGVLVCLFLVILVPVNKIGGDCAIESVCSAGGVGGGGNDGDYFCENFRNDFTQHASSALLNYYFM